MLAICTFIIYMIVDLGVWNAFADFNDAASEADLLITGYATSCSFFSLLLWLLDMLQAGQLHISSNIPRPA